MGDNSFRELSDLRVGYHVQSGPTFVAWCQWRASSAEVIGTLPPGLTLVQTEGGGGSIEGTPRQPGTWTVSYRLNGLHCTGPVDPGQHVYDPSLTQNMSYRLTITVKP